MFYLFYLRRRQADWLSLRMRTSPGLDSDQSMSTVELGLKKEDQEPSIFTYTSNEKECYSEDLPDLSCIGSPLIDALCSVCLGDYQADDKLQQIPACGHTFHMDCIDHWLAYHTTCPLCRLSVLASPKALDKLAIIQAANIQESSHPVNRNGLAVQPVSQIFGGTQGVQPLEQTIGDARISQHNSDEQECVDQEREFRNTRDETNEHEGSRGTSGNFLLLTSLAYLTVFGRCYLMNVAFNLFLHMQFW
ncbi:hypothetical protein V6N13_065852 [Hibiscus sabdariffa]